MLKNLIIVNEGNESFSLAELSNKNGSAAVYRKTSGPNLKWDDSTPYDAQQYLNNLWALVRAELNRKRSLNTIYEDVSEFDIACILLLEVTIRHRIKARKKKPESF